MDYLTVFEDAKASIVIKKSEFIAHLHHAQSAGEAQDFIDAIKKEHFRARHNCYAYVIGESGELKKASDDGEPSSTAGRPILSAIENAGLVNVVIVVTRYFGGIKLGANGLVRAYMSAAKEAVENAKTVKMSECFEYDLTYDYSFHGKVDSFVRSEDILSEEPEFSDRVNVRVYIPESREKELIDGLVQITNGRIEKKRNKKVFMEKEI